MSDGPTMMNTADRLETPKQLAARVGLTDRQIRNLIGSRQLEHIRIGGRVHITPGAWARFVEDNKVKPCRDETKAPSFAGSTSVGAITSPGPNAAAAASARLARQTASKLKLFSRSGSPYEAVDEGRVIPVNCS
jgi:hypothetical protein